MSLFFLLLLQVISQLPIPISEVPIAGEIVGPLIFREDLEQTTKVILQNGMTVIVREQHAIPLTSVTTHVKVGYFDEPDRVSGISHVIEHMFFKGTERRQVGQIAKETKELGGFLNAYTAYDRTVYRVVVPSANTVAAIDIQADALWNPTFDAEELSREIEVVIQENNRKLDNPSAVASEKLYETAFHSHRMRRWRIGTAEGLRALTRHDVVAYYQKYYQPSNVILTIVGRFDREELLDEVIQLYGDVQDIAVERDSTPSEAPQADFRYNWERGSNEQTHIAIGYHVPGALSEERFGFDVIRAILTTGRASRINRFLRDEQGVISSGSASLSVFRDLGYFEIALETVTSPVAAGVAALAEIEQIKQFGVTGEELSRAKTLLAQEFYHRLETVDGIAEELSRHEALGDWKRTNAYLPGIQRVKASDVSRLANKYFTNDNLGFFEYLPVSVTRSFSSIDFRDNVLQLVTRAVIERSVEELPVSAEVRPLDQELVQDLVHPVVQSSILRGPDVYVVEDHRLPLVSFGIFYPGGRLYESTRNAGITELMLRSALRGTRRYNTADIGRRLENAGARIQVVNEQDFFGYILDGISGEMDQALEILMEILQEPVFPDEEVELQRGLQQARISKLREDNLRYPVQLFMSTVFDGHSYARSAVGSKETLASLTREDLAEWHKLHQRTLVPVIVIVGDTQGTGLMASITETLTNEDLFERDISTLPTPALDLGREENIETASRKQTALVYGFIGPTNSNPDRFALRILGNVVSGLGGRFFEAIREQQGLAYTVMASDVPLTKSGVVFTYTAFSPANEIQVLEALEAEIESLIVDGITEDELRKAINYSIGVHEMRLQTRRGRILAYARAVYAGTGVSSVDDYSRDIQRVGLDFVQSVAARYLSPATAKIAILRGTN